MSQDATTDGNVTQDTKVVKEDPLDTGSIAYSDNRKIEEAKRFIRNIKWRWDIISERGAKPNNGLRPKVSVRRFAPGAPLGSVRIILDMLTDSAPYINPVISGDVIQGKWKPRMTWFRKDMQQQTYDMRADATVTIIQDLVPDYGEGETDAFNAGGDCSEITEYEYVWDAAEVSVPPMPYPQGVSYGVQAVNRDDESGLFNYMIVKRTAIEQHFGPYISSSSAKAYITTEVYKNAYNIPEDLPQEGDEVDGGKAVRVSIVPNDDCTYNIQIDRSFTNKAKAQRSCVKTVFEHNDSEQTTGEDSALGEAPEAKGGVVTTHISTLEDDGTYTNEKRVSTEERNVDYITQTNSSAFIVSKTKAVRGKNIIPSAPSIGSTKATKSDGGLYTTEVTEYVIKGGEESTEKVETSTESKFTRSSVSSAKDTSEASAKGGKIVAVTARQDDQGAWHNQVSLIVEKQAVVSESTTRSPFIDSNTIVTKNASKKETISDSVVGKVANSLTEGGLHNTEVTTYEIKGGLKSESNQDTAFSRVNQTTNISSSKGNTGVSSGGGQATSASAVIDEATGAWTNTVTTTTEKPGYRGNQADASAIQTASSKTVVSSAPVNTVTASAGTIKSATSKMTETGLYEVTERTTNAIAKQWTTTRKQPFVTTTEKNVINSADVPSQSGVVTSQSARMNEFGLYDGSASGTTITGGMAIKAYSNTAFESSVSTGNVSTGPSASPGSAGGGKTTTSRSQIDESTGAWTNTVTTTTEKKGSRGKTDSKDAYQNTVSVIEVKGSPDSASYSVGTTEIVQAAMTESGLYKQTKETSTAKAVNWTTTYKRPLGVQVKVEEFRNKQGNITAPSSSVYKIEETENKYGLFDGSRTSYSKTGGSQYARSMTTGDIDSSTREYTEQRGETTLQEPTFKEYSKGDTIVTEVKSVDETTGLGVITKREEKPKKEESQELTYNAGSFRENTDKFIWNAEDMDSFKPDTDENTVSASVSVSRDKFGNFNGMVRVVKDLGQDNGKGGKWQATFDERGIEKVIQEPHLDSWQPYIRTITITYDYGIKEYEQQALDEYKQSIHLPQYGIVGKFEPIRLNGRDTHFGGRYTRIKKVVIKDQDYKSDVTSKLTSGDGKLPDGGSITFHENGIPTYDFK